MATYITDSTGNNNAEVFGDFTTDAIAETLTFNAGTDGEAKPLKVLESTRQWLVVEVRAIGVAGVLGKHVYSENVADIQTRVEAIRQDMIALHSSFTITCTHYKTDNICDVYRGDEATAIALAVDDTNINYTPPGVWVIDDLTPFSPTTPNETNLVVDPTCDNAGEWSTPAGISITGGKMEVNNSTGASARIFGNLIEVPELVEYRVGCTVSGGNGTGWRLYIGDKAGGYQYATSGDVEQLITYVSGGSDFGVQALDGSIMTLDDFYVIRS